MRRLLLASAIALATLVGCSHDDDQATECKAPGAGATVNDAATCSAPPAGDTAAVDAFRSHVVRTSSAAGAATRVIDGLAAGIDDCMAQIVASTVVAALSSAMTGTEKDLPVDCTNELEANGFASFSNGTYTVHGQERGGKTGEFVVDSSGTSTLRVYLTRDANGFHKGDLVTVDVLKLDAYLVNAHLVLDAKGDAAIGFDAPGPLAEVLGKGATPPNPLPVTDDLRTALSTAYEIEGSVHTDVSDCGSEFHTVSDQTIPRTAITNDIVPALVSAITTGPQGQVITAKTWDATYTSANSGAPTGHVDADVAGVTGVAHARVDFDDPSGVTGTLTLICK